MKWCGTPRPAAALVRYWSNFGTRKLRSVIPFPVRIAETACIYHFKQSCMPLPEKREALVALGYVFDNEARCRGCGAAIEWWITPNGKKMPMTVRERKDESKG